MDVHSLVVVYGGSLRFYRLTPDGIFPFFIAYINSRFDCCFLINVIKEWKVE